MRFFFSVVSVWFYFFSNFFLFHSFSSTLSLQPGPTLLESIVHPDSTDRCIWDDTTNSCSHSAGRFAYCKLADPPRVITTKVAGSGENVWCGGFEASGNHGTAELWGDQCKQPQFLWNKRTKLCGCNICEQPNQPAASDQENWGFYYWNPCEFDSEKYANMPVSFLLLFCEFFAKISDIINFFSIQLCSLPLPVAKNA